MNVEERTNLEDERDYLLWSLLTLEDELAEGSITQLEYEALHDDQTHRAAEVMRALDAYERSLAEETEKAVAEFQAPETVEPRSGQATKVRNEKNKKPLIWTALIVAFVAIAGGAIAMSAGGRLSGQTSSGNVPGNSANLATQARELTAKGQVGDAAVKWDAVLKLEPNNVEALAYRGWLTNLGGLKEDALRMEDQAISVDPGYPDAHLFRGLILLRGLDRPADAVPELQRYLDTTKNTEMTSMVRQALDDAQSRANASRPAGR